MFEKILIANRGEIACRIIETARRLGVSTVAVYSDVDAGAKHVALADEAFHIGGAAPADSYLRGDRIIGAARATGAQAIHPGYGFLSENPEFVEAVVAAGLAFVGPSADAIRKMGLKDAAKALMQEAGVPVVPGYQGALQEPAHLAQQADAIGYPVLIKAVAGGGGKGMRRVERPQDFAAALSSAQNEAKTAFGNDVVLIEKFVQHPRHIEVQVFGDGTRAVHLFERDCSLQRRHQKVIEEAPAPGMSEEMRAAMGTAAVRAAEAINYSGAGTVEFIVDGSEGLSPDRFWFMEMNTRLQVEHPVTELITGIDLVEWQLRVAAGEPLPQSQDDLVMSGHAFEARLYAEDVPKGFLPATGQLSHLRFPDGCRADSGVRTGDEISPWYDPMIAKLIVHGENRQAALQKLSQALQRVEVAGTTTNLPFLGALARHSGFAAGEVDTDLIARDLNSLVITHRPMAVHKVAAAMTALDLFELSQDAGFNLWGPLRQSVTLVWQGEPFVAEVRVLSQTEQLWQVEAQELSVHFKNQRWECAGQALPVTHKADDKITVFAEYGHVFERPDPLARDVENAADTAVIQAPMPGLVRGLFVDVGDTVAEGDRLVVLEAMKMEHALLSARDGAVAEVLVREGEQVEAGAALVRLEDN
ncbi:acetyl/propionyl/methylcrotonyl-CoA carboxylase subunit alpha [Epibacterium ulvae]|uniref:acetyl/propionyl/methylcrotonyl-CoA carboxylase subunit alpha n=1 Tax=Epibacterium ulvae TaxID=1156985 RepID=UPI002492C03D|nr:acetyl/propionyl/methylcrotonyl-CoA carboxylase subunit alpha [Epibacterium ulvae]